MEPEGTSKTVGELSKEGLLFLAKIAEIVDRKDAEAYKRLLTNPPENWRELLASVRRMVTMLEGEIRHYTASEYVQDSTQYIEGGFTSRLVMRYEEGLIHKPNPGDVIKAITDGGKKDGT